MNSPFNSDGTITVTNNQTSLGLANKAAALVALTKVEGGFLYSECAAALLGTRKTTQLLGALTRYGNPRLAE